MDLPILLLPALLPPLARPLPGPLRPLTTVAEAALLSGDSAVVLAGLVLLAVNREALAKLETLTTPSACKTAF